MRGRGYSGRDCAGRGSGRSSAHGGRNTTTEHKKQTMEFTPHTAGKHQSVTYDTVEEHILQEIQKDLKNGSDLAVNLQKGLDSKILVKKPIRLKAISIKKKARVKSRSRGTRVKTELEML